MASKLVEFRLYDFNEYNKVIEEDNDSDQENKSYTDKKEYYIQMFGIDSEGKTASIIVQNYEPFFYVKVPDEWNRSQAKKFERHLLEKMGKFYKNSIVQCKVEKHKKLYGFDAGKLHTFIFLSFKNIQAFNKAKNMWYEQFTDSEGNFRRKLIKGGYIFDYEQLQLYEANIPPLLRLFHIKNISPSGWIGLPEDKIIEVPDHNTICDVEYIIHYEHIVSLNDKEDLVPYVKASFDIEASSSHGDFPLPVKSYKKLATNIIDFILKYEVEDAAEILEKAIMTAFGYGAPMDEIELVFPKKQISRDQVKMKTEQLLKRKSSIQLDENSDDSNSIETLFMIQQLKSEGFDDDGIKEIQKRVKEEQGDKQLIPDFIINDKYDRTTKITHLTYALGALFPPLEGDKVTFIGTTFTRHGETEPYLNHCIVLDSCDTPKDVKNCVIESYATEKEVLLAWKELLLNERPHFILGYNIFGFDYDFMYYRAKETGCLSEFLRMSKNRGELCGSQHPMTQAIQIHKSSIVIASGQHDLNYIKMSGIVQVDLYNDFRRNFNLTSYKLDYVAGHFIGDNVNKLQHNDGNTDIYSKNLAGLQVGAFIHFEETAHTTDYYQDGSKFKVIAMDNGKFTIEGEHNPNMKLSVRWCLAKDDVTPQDIFRLTNEGPAERAIVAKYCIQDCNLVHELFNKIDIMTGFVEMAKICSVPINFLVIRGQGIKLTSFIAKKCREKNTLMPVIEKKFNEDGYEGAIVLEPKCNLYLDIPVACVDYSSLYPSSMISENLCHSSKVWTKEYDLEGNELRVSGEKDEHRDFIYDNMDGYEYVNVQYDTYKYVRKSPKAAAQKIKCGYKICRWAQYPDGEKAIMPSVLDELLKKRKATKKLCAKEQDPFMKNILDKRQLSIKLTANSLYGQTGATTSTFYEKDVAASTTAVGRQLLTYAKRVIEDVYGDCICKTKYGKVQSRAEYIYGDTDSVFFTFNFHDLEGNPIRGKKALEMTIEMAQEAGALATKALKKPHDLEYEKTFMPFCLLSKKRYVGMLYEFDPNKCKRKSMGIVLKRRDNAPIVKDIYGGVIDILMNEQDITKSVQFLNQELQKIVDGKCPMEKLIISKSLRSHYKAPQQIAHKVLADRIGARDPGNKPRNGDRIPFVYIVNENKKALQGERIETPDFIKSNRIKIDYAHYISNQIMKPLLQVFALIINELPGFKNKPFKRKKFNASLNDIDPELTGDKLAKKIEQITNKEVKKLLFDNYLTKCNTLRSGNATINSFFTMK